MLTLRLMAWERAKGELGAIPATYWPAAAVDHDPETMACKTMRKRVEALIDAVASDL